MTKTSPVWPPFPGCGYEGSYVPVLAEQLVAEQAAAKAGKQGAKVAKTKGKGWGTGTIRGLSRNGAKPHRTPRRKGGAR